MEFADQCTSKRLVRTAMAAIRDGHKEGEAAEELDILPFFQRTSLFPSAILKRAIQAACDEIDDELGILVKDEFETFVRLFDRICKGGTGEYEELSDRVAGLVHALQVCPAVLPSRWPTLMSPWRSFTLTLPNRCLCNAQRESSQC